MTMTAPTDKPAEYRIGAATLNEQVEYWRDRFENERANHWKNQRTIAELNEALRSVLRHCVTINGMPDKGDGRTEEQQLAYDQARELLRKAGVE